MQPFRADLHCHSTCSDGSLSPIELLHAAVKSDLQGLSITDHDTIDAYAQTAGAVQNISLISGVEFSATLEGSSVHILGYSFSLAAPAIQELCQRHTARRKARNLEILDKLAKLKMPLTMEEVASLGRSTVGRPHIALAMMKRGYVASVQEAFKRYIGEGRPAYAKGSSIDVEETLAAIHQAKGAAVIAHPHLIADPNLIQKLLTMPFEGIECYYARFSPESNDPWIDVAKRRGWLMTGGSDFHGAVKPTIPLGASWAGEETFRVLKEMHEKNN